MKRSELREYTFKMLFQLPFYEKEEWEEQIGLSFQQILSDVVDDKIDNMDNPDQKQAYLEQKEQELRPIKWKTKEIMTHLQQLDEQIETLSEGWKLKRIGKAELAILRLAIFEIQQDKEVPIGVAINEAVELSKQYGSDKSSKFINGILGKLATEEVE